MSRPKEWPSLEQMIENAERGLIDDSADAIPPPELMAAEQAHSQPPATPARQDADPQRRAS